MQKFQKPIGVLGGTFDPVHFGHLRMAVELHESLNLDKVHVIPCFQPVHRKKPSASPDQRLSMLECAAINAEDIIVDACEIKRQGPSYTIDTLIEMRQQLPDTPLCLLVGIDAFLGFNKWHQYKEIFNYAHIVIAHRPQYQIPDKGEIAELIQSRLQNNISYIHNHLSGGILLQAITLLEISASEIRKIIAENRSPRYLLPDMVYNYILEKQIYTNTQS